MQKIITLLCCIALSSLFSQAQGLVASEPDKKVNWQIRMEKTDNAHEYQIIATAKLIPSWHVFGEHPGDDFLIPTHFTFESENSKLIKTEEEGKLKTEIMEGVGTIHYYEKEVSFKATVQSKEKEIVGFIEFQVCNATMCLPPTQENFKFTVK